MSDTALPSFDAPIGAGAGHDTADAPLALGEPEVRRLVRLLADALAPDDGRPAKVARLMAGLSAWLDVDGWFWVRSRVCPTSGVPENYDFLYGGALDDRHLAVWSERSLEVHGSPPENAPLRARLAAGEHFTLPRGEVLSDDAWAAGPGNLDYVRRLGHDATIYSIKPMQALGGGRVVSYVQLLRAVGKPAFDARDARLAHAVLGECGPLHADGLNLSVAADVAGLTPRQRTVLAMLIDGHAVRHAAERLGLSPHTVNDHCKSIYKHFGVNSRARLLRRFMTGTA